MAVPDTESAGGPSPGATPPPSPPARPDLPPRWPAAVRTELLRRHDELVASLADVPEASVLDLSVPAGRTTLAAAIAGDAAGPVRVDADRGQDGAGQDGRGYDAVVSVAGLTRFPDLGAALEAAAALLSPTGQLVVVEPHHRTGVTGLAVSSFGALLPPARGVHLARDVPATVRATGLTITDVRRFSVPTLVWPLRSFVRLRALRINPDVGSAAVGADGRTGGSA